jgi:nitroimidazol reductase NimA-like FMN-containing flavoprotein (pyridoxamine 5'-phosphate oxidase superfamily)
MEPMNQAQRRFVLDIMRTSPDMTLATVRPDGYPQATTVSFANDGLTIYAAVGLDSQKAHNIRDNPRVSLTINCAYSDWNHIRGLSIGARAEIIDDPVEMKHASTCLLRRFPQVQKLMEGTGLLPWAGVVFIRVTPEVISILDYKKAFGHTELVSAH